MKNRLRSCAWLCGLSGAMLVGCLLAGCSGDDAPTPTSGDSAAEGSPDFGGGDAAPLDGEDSDEADGADGDGAIDDADGDPLFDAGTPADCLSATTMDKYFTLPIGSTKCVVAQYASSLTGLSAVAWGRHGGPLWFDGGTTTIMRLTVPSGSTGDLILDKTKLTVSGVPSGAYWGVQAIDLPFFDWTVVAYTGSGTGFPGEAILVDGAGALTRYDVNGYFAGVGVGLMSVSGGRLLHTGLSPIGTSTTSTNAGALYAADSCGSVSTTPRLVPAGDSKCKDPIKVSTWEAGSSGPVAKDAAENVFAVLSKFGGNYELRGFERSTIARGSGAAAGDKLISVSKQFVSELAADGKNVYVQAIDGSTYAALDVQALAYKVDMAAKTVSASGSATTFLKMVTAGRTVTLFADDKKRLWVATDAISGGDSGKGSIVFVLREKSP